MLAVVPTPLGNLEDMTPRGLEALKRSRGIFCEDTRRTRVLMSYFGISKPLVRFNERDEFHLQRLVDRMKEGGDWALVTDGGTPAISDPGGRLVALSRRAGISVTALPGASAVSAALSGSGLPADSFVFLGFLPRSAGKQKRVLSEAGSLGRTLVIYESPFRVLPLLETAASCFGAEAEACVVRELSKIHEEWFNGTLGGIRENLAGREKIQGEFVVIIRPERKVMSNEL